MIKNNFIQRAVTGALIVAVLVGCIIFSPLTFAILFVLISSMAVHEFCLLVNQNEDVSTNTVINVLGGVYLFFSFLGFCMGLTGSQIFIPYLFLLIYLLISELYLKKENPVINLAYSMLSQLYVALPFALLNVLAFQSDITGAVTFNYALPLSIFIFIWLNDTGAYCFGTLFGKHRLFERISPKKSWEGSIGGGIITLASSFVFAHFFPFISPLAWAGLSLTVCIFGTWGDLVESMIKRHMKIKDSGSIFPGHGGILDRFDSAMIAIPASVIYLYTISLLK
ncbi:phosphatidate cytidylyltransferase [Bacteroides sedimenti]|uniref:Phosphatidate cytidylyltransferase n=1 Tax=Bacteroides sedimenti TaxID=2136147 RepID=A0ABM8IEV5_9BACE